MSIFRESPKGALPVPIVRIGSKKYGKFHWVPFDEKPFFVTTHYLRGERTQPCMGASNGCVWCTGGETPAPTRERAYIGGMLAERKLSGVLELTERAGVELLQIAKSQSLVGMVIKCGRVSEKANSAITLEPTGQSANGVHAYLQGWDTIANLCATWGIEVPHHAKLHSPEAFAERGHDREDVWKGAAS